MAFRRARGIFSASQNGVLAYLAGDSGDGPRATFTVRKTSGGIGVERVFPLHSPNVQKIDVVRRGLVRRAKLYYLRKLRGKKARIKERRV